LAAGAFGDWAREVTAAQTGDAGVDVPCGSCTACCRSSYFIHIGPKETRTLRRIPAALMFPAPGLAKGHMVMGYDERGHCPMLIDDRCSIYDDRPRTCRNFDCRVFAAAGLSPEADHKPEIAVQVGKWRFDYPSEADASGHTAMQAAAAFLSENPACFPGGIAPSSAGQLALLSLKVHRLFIDGEPDVESVKAALR